MICSDEFHEVRSLRSFSQMSPTAQMPPSAQMSATASAPLVPFASLRTNEEVDWLRRGRPALPCPHSPMEAHPDIFALKLTLRYGTAERASTGVLDPAEYHLKPEGFRAIFERIEVGTVGCRIVSVVLPIKHVVV